MSQKQVKIIGLSVVKDFGGLKATELSFDEKNRLTVIKGEVGSGKTTLNTAMRLTTQGSSTLTDKNLYGEVDVTTQLSDGDKSIYVGCRSNKDGNLSYFLYTVDENGKKVKDVVVDGKRLTPASYLESLQTALTWRLDELTSQNPTTQRNILLELYQNELEKEGVIFDKSHPKFTESIIHQIEAAKNRRSLMDMRRKEVGGIADDMSKKGINYEVRRKLKDLDALEKAVSKIEAKISLAETNFEQNKESELNKIKLDANIVLSSIKDTNQKNIKHNEGLRNQKTKSAELFALIDELITEPNRNKLVKETVSRNLPDASKEIPEIKFDEKGKVKSKSKDFEGYDQMRALLSRYKILQKKYKKTKSLVNETNNEILQEELEAAKRKLDQAKQYNDESKAVNSFQDWQEANDEVTSIKKDYYLKLTNIKTGVKGLHICIDDSSENDENIYLMYNGSYDKKYFNNPDKELRKLSSYSGTQKPMICLLIQNYLLSKKEKALPYLWIDDVPIDKKTRELLEKMAKELGLWLFVNWTGDFKAKNLKNGEILLENGEILMKQND